MVTRRNFINSTLVTGAALATQGAQKVMAHENRMIVDAQAHLWKAESDDWKWVPGRKPQLPEPFTIEKLLPLMDEGGVDRVVIVPPSWPGDRNDYALEAARRYPNRFAVMGRIALEKPESAALIPTWLQQPGMKGIRLTFQREQAAMLEHADWIFPAAEKAGIPIMFFAPGNMPRFAAIAERHPGLPLIVDHMSLTNEIAKEGTIAPCTRRRHSARQISERLGQSVLGAEFLQGGLSVSRHDRALEALLRCIRPAALLLGHRPDQFARQGDLPPAHRAFHQGAAVPL